MIANHWDFVLTAYALFGVVLLGYWRHLARRERELSRARRPLARGARRTTEVQAPTAPRSR